MSSGSSHKALELARWLADDKFAFLSSKRDSAKAGKQAKNHTAQAQASRKLPAKKR
jgi:hypothetical protein